MPNLSTLCKIWHLKQVHYNFSSPKTGFYIKKRFPVYKMMYFEGTCAAIDDVKIGHIALTSI
jgi:hypothetical protein